MDDTCDRRPLPDGGSPDGDERPGSESTDGGPVAGDPGRTAVVRELYDVIPFHQVLELEVDAVTCDRAETTIPFDESLVGNPDLEVLHGGIISSIVDLTGAAVFIGECEEYTPTVDLRVNYLEAAGTQPLTATATVERSGENIGVASVEVRSGETLCATGTGVYKLSY
jgi:uncharacterized protein (TIGR00369 family)